jgi:hypothetical protein
LTLSLELLINARSSLIICPTLDMEGGVKSTDYCGFDRRNPREDEELRREAINGESISVHSKG